MGHSYNEIVVGPKKENFTLCNNMDGPREHYANEMSQSEEDKYHMISPVWNLMN